MKPCLILVGEPTLSHTILVNDAMLPSTRNLHEALIALRHRDEERILWIDAICIDQKNGEERTHQVLQMSAIYKEANQVIVWLGQPNYTTNYVVREMRRFETEILKHVHAKWLPADERWADIWHALDEASGIDRRSSATMKEGYLDLLNRTWFERIWILQEVAHARSARVVCGLLDVSVRVFALMPNLLEVSPSLHCQAVLDIMPGPMRKHSWYGQDRKLLSLARKFRCSKAFDPRDRIYALLAMASDTKESVDLTPDYSKGVGEVVLAMIALFLGIKGGFSFTELPFEYPMNWVLDCMDNNFDDMSHTLLKDSITSREDIVTMQLLDTGKINLAYKRNKWDETPVFTAARSGAFDILKRLMSSEEVDLESMDHNGWTLETLAAAEGHDKLFELLLDRRRPHVKAYVHTGIDNFGEEILAVKKASMGFEMPSIRIDAPIEYRSPLGTYQPPLWWAIECGSYSLAEALLKCCHSYQDTVFFNGINLLCRTTYYRQKQMFDMIVHYWPTEVAATIRKTRWKDCVHPPSFVERQSFID